MSSFLGSKAREEEIVQALAQEIKPSLEKSAAAETKQDEQENVLASVVNTLVKCADKLDTVGHSAANKVDEVLAYIDTEFFKETDKK